MSRLSVKKIKMIVHLKRISFAILLVGSGVAYGQTAKEALKEMNKRYGMLSSYQMNVQVAVKTSTGSVISSYKGKSAKQGEQFYTEIMGKKMLVNAKYMIAVDEAQKIIVFGVKPKDQKADPNSDPMAMVDELFANSKEEIKFYKNTDTYFYVRVVMKDHPLYKHADLKIRKSDYALLNFDYQVKAGTELSYQRIEVRYTDVKLNKALGKNFFSEKQFVNVSGQKVSPVSKYSGYEVIDQRKQTYEAN